MALTDEQIKEALKSEAFTSAVTAAVEAETKGLKKKNDDLLNKVKKADELETRLEEIEKERDEATAKAAKNGGDVDKAVEAANAKSKKEIDKLTASLEKSNSQLQKHVVDGGLTAALMNAKFAPEHMDAVKALIQTRHKGEVGDNDGSPFAKFDGKAVEDFVKDFAQTDVGKRYVLAENNSGGSSNGANGNGKAGAGSNGKTKTMTRSAFDALPPMERAGALKDGTTLTEG